MNKTLKLALLPAAVASAMFANNALAGTEACFEVYKSAANAVTNQEVLYTSASCVAVRGGADAADLEEIVPTTVAWELTKDHTVDGENVNAANDTLNIVYIPTTDVPPASRITMKLNGATWAASNNNQIHLIKAQDVAGTVEYSAVGSSDGTFTDKSEVTFITKAGVTIGAGTRLVLSLTNNIADDTAGDMVSPKVRIQNTGCAPANAVVSIEATDAATDAGQKIAGASTNGKVTNIADISAQFSLATVNDGKIDAQVNAEAPAYRMKFVATQSAGDWVNEISETSLLWVADFENKAGLDQFVTLDGTDHVKFSFNSDNTAGETVDFNLFKDGADETLTPLDASAVNLLKGTAAEVEVNGTTVYKDLTTDASMQYDALSTDIFGAAGTTHKVGFHITNTSPTGVMNFNYNVNAKFDHVFGDDLSQLSCKPAEEVASVGVNGAVLKVPYAYDTDKNWVRITNEHTSDAEITVEVFAETKDGTGTTSETFTLGNVAQKDSVLYKADDIIAQYKAAYAGDVTNLQNRYTFTFTVTAPKNSVHGVSVQAIPNGVDRVMPVLDQNDWSQ